MTNPMTIPRFTHPDEEKFGELMNRSYRKVYNMAYRLSGNRNDAEDLTQEAFYRAYRGFNEFQGDRPFENWILRIVSRLFLDLVRARKRRVQVLSYDAPISKEGEDQMYFDVAETAPGPEQVLISSTLSEEMESTLQVLTPEQRLLVTLADIERVPYKEISILLDKPVGTIRSRLHRAHKAMRARLESLRLESGMMNNGFAAAR